MARVSFGALSAETRTRPPSDRAGNVAAMAATRIDAQRRATDGNGPERGRCALQKERAGRRSDCLFYPSLAPLAQASEGIARRPPCRTAGTVLWVRCGVVRTAGVVEWTSASVSVEPAAF